MHMKGCTHTGPNPWVPLDASHVCRQSEDEAPARVMVFASSEAQARQLADPLRTVLWGDHKISGGCCDCATLSGSRRPSHLQNLLAMLAGLQLPASR